jgi:hypothetical protein
MDLKIKITDENGETLQSVSIYQDGGDYDGAQKIADYIAANFKVECPVCGCTEYRIETDSSYCEGCDTRTECTLKDCTP